ncbi:MAG: type II toxin-antitoxin system Phd/YefM family antitoxin [Nitrospirales bacterium]
MLRKDSTVNIHQAKTQLSRLLDDVVKGKTVVIAKAGKPVAKLIPLEEKKPSRKPGFLKGKLQIATDFDAPLPPDLQEAFEAGT